MKIKTFFPALLFSVSAAATAFAQTPTDWNAGRDLVANEKPDGGAQETANPNATVPQWSYGYRDGVAGTALTLFTAADHSNALGQQAGQEGYEGASTAVGANTTNHDIVFSFCCGPLYPVASGEMALGVNSANRSAVVRWTAPASGNYTYHADWRDIDPNGGDGAAGYVVINGQQVFGQSWTNGNNNGATTTAAVTLAAGDVIDFLLNPNGDISYDTTRVTFTVVNGGTPTGCINPPSGLASQYSAENDAKDSIGTNHGTLKNSTSFASGETGQAFQFAENNYVSIPDAASLHPSSLTVEGWINFDVLNPGHAQSIFTKAFGAAGLDSLAVWYQSGVLHGATSDTNGYTIIDYSWQPGVGTWHHVAYTFDGTSHALYVDGMQAATGANTRLPVYDAHLALIGADYYGDLNSSIIDFFLGKIDELSLYNRALTAGEIQSIFGAGIQGKCKPPVAPVHGGLSDTKFTVNESDAPSNNVNDTVLRFHAVQTGTPAKLLVRVQANAGTGWVDLPDGLSGRMAYAPQVTGYVLHSTNYPLASGVRFRAVSSAPGYKDSFSNEVGPFNLLQNQPHLGATLLFVTTNGEINAIRFGVKEATVPAGTFLRIQSTQTPAMEDSWSDVSINNTALMQQDPADLNQFYLGTDEYPEGEGIYFRAVASNSNGGGYVKSISIPYGPFKFVHDPAATVSISINGANTTPNDIDGGYLLPSGGFTMRADATSGRFLRRITLLYDGNVVKFALDGANNVELADFRTNIPGDHVVEAYATDDLGVTGAAAPIHVRILPASPGKAFLMTNSGSWNDSANWIDIQGNHGVPGANDFAILSTFSPTLTTDVTVNAMSMNGGTLDGTKTLTVTGFCTIADGTIKANLTIPSGSTCELLNDSDIALSGTLSYSGILRLHGKGGISGIHNPAGQPNAGGPNPDFSFGDVFGAIKGFGQAIVDLVSGGRRGSKAAPAPAHPIAVPEVKHIAAKIAIPTGKVTVVPAPSLAAIVSHDGGGIVSHDGGGIVSHDGGGLVAAGAGNLVAAGAGNLVAAGAGNLITQDGAGLIAAGAGNLIATGGGNLVAAGAGNLIAAGAGNIASSSKSSTEAPAASAGITLGGGEINLSGLMIFGDVVMDGGILSGSGVIVGSLTNNKGFISPGHSAGILAVTGSFAQGPNGTLIVENGGATPDKFDQLLVGGSTTLGGRLDVKVINGYTPDQADTFAPLGYGSVSGNFASVSGNAQVTMGDTGLLSSVNPSIASTPYGQPLNISTRMKVLTGDNVLIGGFIVTGPSGSTKKVLIRGIGPSLSNAGLSGVLSDPLLEFHKPDGSTTTNDNWGDAPNKDQIPNGFAPSNPKESIVLADLAPGAYTVIEKGAHGESGIGLTEIYDVDGSTTVALANISTRGFVDTNDNVMIGGFIIGGSEPATVLVRASGPSLANNLNGVLLDPVLELHDSNGNVIINDNWRETQETEVIASTVAPSDDREPAIVANLVAGGYTAIVRGSNHTTGLAVVEAYKIK